MREVFRSRVFHLFYGMIYIGFCVIIAVNIGSWKITSGDVAPNVGRNWGIFMGILFFTALIRAFVLDICEISKKSQKPEISEKVVDKSL